MAGDFGKELSVRTAVYARTPGRVYAVLLFVSVCYFGKYFCTSDMYITQELFREAEGISSAQMSVLFAMGYVSSVMGKIAAGVLSDLWGGKPVLMMSAAGYVICTLILSCVRGSFFSFLCAWFVNCFFALGITWVAVVAMVSNWIPVSHMGRLMALVSLAPQLGDALARACLAVVIDSCADWRMVFRVAATVAFCITLPVALLLRNAPLEEEEKAAMMPKQQVQNPAHKSFVNRVGVLCKNPLLYAVAGLSGALYGIRVLFLLYSATFLASTYCTSFMPEEDLMECMRKPKTLAATSLSSMSFTLAGCVSVLLVGHLKDSLPKRHCAGMIVSFVAVLVATLAVLTVTGVSLSYPVSAALVGLIGLTLFGPYKVLGTAFANDIGGKSLKATACSIMGMSDNATAVLVLLIKGQLGSDWVMIFAALLVMSIVAMGCAGTMWAIDLKKYREEEKLQPATGYIALSGS
eukprot:CAMPEP_0195088308 /NCGR_PEP_ID=MMETSP0448-20130528/27909_1 /TAXON_ID=66468 /ORGANISM="Heterocapsa triquestra, Strain CCMP 448" /LENGTH=463 /DNA_ID=CAMNT_0040121949 /DNA_START=10 /DNA_END=1401 /DNA_ORIENTATION=+